MEFRSRGQPLFLEFHWLCDPLDGYLPPRSSDEGSVHRAEGTTADWWAQLPLELCFFSIIIGKARAKKRLPSQSHSG